MEHITKKNLRLIIEDLLFEDVRYGMYDQPGPKLGDSDKDDEDDEKPEVTVTPDVPLKPTEMMAHQLADEKPPIEDEDYKPSNVKELERASSSLASLVPEDQVEFFYKEMHRLVDSAVEKQNEPDPKNNPLDDEDDEEKAPLDAEKDEETEEEKLKGESRLREASWDEGGYSETEYDEMGMTILPEFEAAAEEMTQEAPTEEGGPGDGKTLEQIADEFGFSGAPGARQHIDKILKRMTYFSVTLSMNDVSTLQDFAVNEFIDLMRAEDYLDEQDVVELQQAPGAVKELDSFRFFFVSAFVLPGYQAVQREAKKRLEAHLESQGIPKELWQTVVNQATGDAERNSDKLASKIGRVSAKIGLSPEDAAELGKNLESSFEALIALVQPEADMIERSQERWASMDKGKRSSILKKALQQTSDYQAEIDAVSGQS